VTNFSTLDSTYFFLFLKTHKPDNSLQSQHHPNEVMMT